MAAPAAAVRTPVIASLEMPWSAVDAQAEMRVVRGLPSTETSHRYATKRPLKRLISPNIIPVFQLYG